MRMMVSEGVGWIWVDERREWVRRSNPAGNGQGRPRRRAPGFVTSASARPTGRWEVADRWAPAIGARVVRQDVVEASSSSASDCGQEGSLASDTMMTRAASLGTIQRYEPKRPSSDEVGRRRIPRLGSSVVTTPEEEVVA
uniref:Uncharacterized protein n=1 Tax=Oryza glumipatula TaxID=40148 RepID=A0A0E0BQ35_9ORYZ